MMQGNMRSVLCLAAAVLIAALPACGQQHQSAWKLVRESDGFTEISARSEISTPKDAGFAVLRIVRGAGRQPGISVSLVVESPKRLPQFPFEKYDGPIDKTRQEFMDFEVVPGVQGKTAVRALVPNGGYVPTPPEAFAFTTSREDVIRALSGVRDGQKLNITVNGSPNSIQVAFDTTGLKQLIDQMMKTE
jgi:hypothetical protein